MEAHGQRLERPWPRLGHTGREKHHSEHHYQVYVVDWHDISKQDLRRFGATEFDSLDCIPRFHALSCLCWIGKSPRSLGLRTPGRRCGMLQATFTCSSACACGASIVLDRGHHRRKQHSPILRCTERAQGNRNGAVPQTRQLPVHRVWRCGRAPADYQPTDAGWTTVTSLGWLAANGCGHQMLLFG